MLASAAGEGEVLRLIAERGMPEGAEAGAAEPAGQLSAAQGPASATLVCWGHTHSTQ